MKGIQKSFGSIEVLKNIDLNIHEGKLSVILGASGAGKSTLLQIMGTLERADKGELIYGDVSVNHLSTRELARFRNRKIGFVFQFHHLLPEFTALENVCIPAYIAGLSKAKATKKARELLAEMQLEHRLDHKPRALSGGEQQRVAVARALINDPEVVLADEPTGNLDSKATENLHMHFERLKNSLGKTFVLVTHNKDLAALADHQYLITDGKISDTIT